MAVSEITSMITTVGFPIACCIAMAWFVNSTVRDLQKTIESNTTIMEKILTKLNMD